MNAKWEQLDFGPIEQLLKDNQMQEIMINGHDNIYYQRKGNETLVELDAAFRDEDHLMSLIMGIMDLLGRELSAESPMTDVRLPDGSRMNVVIPPIALTGPTVVIRRLLVGEHLKVDDLIGFGSWDEQIVEFLQACMKARLNTVVSGGTGSGKTTVLNCLAGMIPETERIVLVQNADELPLPQKHLVKLESRPADSDGKGEVTIQNLIINSLRMRPDRIILGECRSGEALELLQAMTTGHDGTLFSIHADSPREVLANLETMASMHAISLPLLTIRQKVASGIHLIVQQNRLQDGKRKITKITEVTGITGDVITTQDLFVFEQTGLEDGKIVGHFTPTGNIPGFMDRIKNAGVEFPKGFFAPK